MVSADNDILPFLHQRLRTVALRPNRLVSISSQHQSHRDLLSSFLGQHLEDHPTSLLNIASLFVVPLLKHRPHLPNGRILILVQASFGKQPCARVQESCTEVARFDDTGVDAEGTQFGVECFCDA